MLNNLAFSFHFWCLYPQVKFLTFWHRTFGGGKPAGEMKKVLFLAAFYENNAGYNYRVKQWADILKAEGFEVAIQTVYTEEEHRNWQQHHFTKFLIKGMWRRFRQVKKAKRYDVVIVRREVLQYNDYGNLFMEKLLLTLQPNCILDFDDNLIAAKNEPRKLSTFGKMHLEHARKFTASLQLYPRFFAGSDWLTGLINSTTTGKPDAAILMLPTCVDYHQIEPKEYRQPSGSINIGWIGSDSNRKYLEQLIEPLNALAKDIDFSLVVISGSDWSHPKANFKIDNRKWSLENQLDDLRSIDIGLMPLHYNEVTRGKCAFKLIQYMGLGIVSVASDISANRQAIDDGLDGFLVAENGSWEEKLREVIAQRNKFSEIGRAAIRKIEKHYSFQANKDNVLEMVRRPFNG